ncbi:PRC-barrel domain-containing protein [Hyphomicrobium sp.]|uniref:PRC-barrel domain-containing protein n=1 Tax=Hyphomicrobium sp. TaxID=82 RepID=UPI002D76F466|nr:PRC-barrel domain-containing protein [Hyphomicrobium sp.]HET6388192.1 PRC-barrel domain-containing protein [Hyphomicrobium sp.]
MMSLKLRLALAIALALGAGVALQTVPGSAQDQQQPPAESDQAAPADGGAADSAGASEAQPSTEQPADDGAAPNSEPAQDGGSSLTESPAAPAEAPAPDSADVAPVAPEAPAAAATAVSASELKIGAAVYGADGAKIGEVNGVKSDDAGKVQEILVTDGVAAGINAKVFAISADKIASVNDGVKLSLSAEETRKLPIIDNSSG